MLVLTGLKAKVDLLEFAAAGRALLATSWTDTFATAVWGLPEGGQPRYFGGLIGVQFGLEGAVVGVNFRSMPGGRLTLDIGWVSPHGSPSEFETGTPAP